MQCTNRGCMADPAHCAQLRLRCLSRIQAHLRCCWSDAVRSEAFAWSLHAGRLYGDAEAYVHAVREAISLHKVSPTRDDSARGCHEMTEQRMSSMLRHVGFSDKLSADVLQDSKCPKCGEFMISYNKQKRGADEGPDAVRFCRLCDT